MGLTLANISVFATFVFSVRDLIQSGAADGLDSGGMLWFSDLTVKDPLLAVLAVGASYSAIMVSLGANARAPAAAATTSTMAAGVPASSSSAAAGGGTGTGTGAIVGTNSTLLFFTDLAGTLIICLIPMVLNLPAGVFCYWIPSSMAGAAQSMLLRSPAGLKFLRLPPFTPPAPVSAASTAPKQSSPASVSAAKVKGSSRGGSISS